MYVDKVEKHSAYTHVYKCFPMFCVDADADVDAQLIIFNAYYQLCIACQTAFCYQLVLFTVQCMDMYCTVHEYR